MKTLDHMIFLHTHYTNWNRIKLLHSRHHMFTSRGFVCPTDLVSWKSLNCKRGCFPNDDSALPRSTNNKVNVTRLSYLPSKCITSVAQSHGPGSHNPSTRTESVAEWLRHPAVPPWLVIRVINTTSSELRARVSAEWIPQGVLRGDTASLVPNWKRVLRWLSMITPAMARKLKFETSSDTLTLSTQSAPAFGRMHLDGVFWFPIASLNITLCWSMSRTLLNDPQMRKFCFSRWRECLA